MEAHSGKDLTGGGGDTATNKVWVVDSHDDETKNFESRQKSIDESLQKLENIVLEDEGKSDADVPEDVDGDDKKDKKDDVKLEDDFVDEEAMKTAEEMLTPEEILERTKTAKEHKDSGNEEFKQEKYRHSILSYTKGLLICPLCEKELRSILYSNRAAAKIKMKYKELAVMDCTKSLEYNPDYMKALIRRATLYEELDKLDEALEDYQQILKIDPTYRDAIIATQRLPPLINERNEKLKEEMLGKLKDLGNLVLRPFGLSTANFQLEQQPGGGYSVNFKK